MAVYVSVVTGITLALLCIFKYIPIYSIYIGKQRAKDLIERLESYRKQNGEYPETLKPIGFPSDTLDEPVEYKGTYYFYTRPSECDFELEITDAEDSPTYYSLTEKWFSTNRAKFINQHIQSLYKRYLSAEFSNKLTTSVHSKAKWEKENISFYEGTTADSIIFIKKFYDRKHIASKGFALVDVKSKQAKPIGKWTVFTYSGKSYEVIYHKESTKGNIVQRFYYRPMCGYF